MQHSVIILSTAHRLFFVGYVVGNEPHASMHASCSYTPVGQDTTEISVLSVSEPSTKSTER